MEYLAIGIVVLLARRWMRSSTAPAIGGPGSAGEPNSGQPGAPGDASEADAPRAPKRNPGAPRLEMPLGYGQNEAPGQPEGAEYTRQLWPQQAPPSDEPVPLSLNPVHVEQRP